jgi:hypothetical protein
MAFTSSISRLMEISEISRLMESIEGIDVDYDDF